MKQKVRRVGRHHGWIIPIAQSEGQALIYGYDSKEPPLRSVYGSLRRLGWTPRLAGRYLHVQRDTVRGLARRLKKARN